MRKAEPSAACDIVKTSCEWVEPNMKHLTCAHLALLTLSFHFATSSAQAKDAANRHYNVLLICVDDLRPELGCYGETHMTTPNMDRLAATGRLFNRHYVQLPTCGASRFALLSGRYPGNGVSYNNGAFSQLKPNDDITTLPECFRSNGYRTVGIGKISHTPDGKVFSYDGRGDGHLEMPDAWDEVTGPANKWGTGWDAFFAYADGSSRTDRRRDKQSAPPFEAADVDDHGYPDGYIADMAVDKLKALQISDDKPFFLAVGFFKPHLPFNAPKKYWDLYDKGAIELAPYRERPEGLNSDIPMHGSGEMFGYTHSKGARESADHARNLRHGYYASVSYTDAQVGRVLDELDRLGLSQNTIVVLWGDHGWHLGDQGIWGKHTLFERALRSAMIVRTPGMKSPGTATDAIIETVDIYPTLASLCGLPTEAVPNDINGQSFTAVLDDPAASTDGVAISFWKSSGHTGVSVRTDQHRITTWHEGDKPPALIEMYDHHADPNETKSVTDGHEKVIADSLRRIPEHWRPSDS